MTPSENGGSQPAGGIHLSARRLHPMSPVLDVMMVARQLIFPLAVVMVGSRRVFIVGPIILVVASLGILWRFVAWTRFSYRIEDGMLRIDEGILRRARHEVPLARIQQVDLRRKLRHRALGVAVVRIDTAGGGSGAEVTLEAVADAEALALRAALLHHRLATTATTAASKSRAAAAVEAAGTTADSEGSPTRSGTGADWTPAVPSATNPNRTTTATTTSGPVTAPGSVTGEIVAQLGTRDLVLAGVTGTSLFAGLTVVGGGFALLGELPKSATDSVFAELGSLLRILPIVLILVLLLLVGFLAAAGAASVLRDHGYLLVRYGSDLHLRRGLLDQREATLAVHRIQAVRVSDNPVRRRIGIVSVQLQSAGSGSQSDGEVSRLTIPLLRVTDLDRLLALVGSPVGAPALIPAPLVARRRARVRALVPVAIVVLAALVVGRSPWALLLVVLGAPALALANLSYSALGHVATPTHIITRWGAVIGQTVYVPVAKTQSVRLLTSALQRRVGLATLHVDVAGQGDRVAIRDGDVTLLRAVRHGALVAPVARLDERATRRRTHAAIEA